MGSNFINFIKYNNAVPIGVAIMFLSFSGAMAASPEVRSEVAQAMLTEEKTIKGVDNSYIVKADLETYMPAIQITGVTEDADNYYVAYDMTTIDIKDYVWQEMEKPKVMQVAKLSLGEKDLGLYVTEHLKDVLNAEIAYLKRVQTIEKQNGVQQVTVATVYSGLVGKFLDPKEETLPGYTPVKTPETSSEDDFTLGKIGGSNGDGKNGGNTSTSGGSTSVGGGSGPRIQLLGSNPAQISLGATYVDLGAVVTDKTSPNIGYSVKGEIIDTSKVGEHTITYTAKNQAGQTTTATRRVIVYDPAKGPPLPQVEPTPVEIPQEEIPTPITATSTPAPQPTLEPEPEPIPTPVQEGAEATTTSAVVEEETESVESPAVQTTESTSTSQTPADQSATTTPATGQ